MSEKDSKFSLFGLLLLGLMALGWGFNWPIMKIVLWDVSPLTFRGLGLTLGGIGILLLARLSGQSLAAPTGYWPRLLLLSVCNIVGWNVLVIYGVAHLPSGRAALLGYTMPLWSMLLSAWLLNEPLTPRRLLALALGMGGVASLMGPDFMKLGAAFSGVLLLLGAAFFWGLGVVLLKRFAVPMSTVSLTGWMMLIGGVPIGLAAIAFEHGTWHAVGLYPALGVIYNIGIAFMFCYWAWNRIVFMVPVAVSSLSSLITPVIGVLSGMWLLHEQPSWRELIAGLLILGAITLVVRAPARAPTAVARDAPSV